MKGFSTESNRMAGFGALMAGSIFALATLIGTGTASAQALVRNRIAAPIRAAQMQPLPGTVHPLTSVASDEGPLNGSTAIHGMTLVFRRSAAQEADLQKLLKAQQTPGSPMYHHWLQPGQFAARYGVSQSDLANVAAWLRKQGFTVDSIPASADRVVFSGTAAQVNSTFQTSMHRYLLHGTEHWANATQVSVPQAIAGLTLRVGHLTTFRPHPQTIRKYVHAAQHGMSASMKPQYTLEDVNGDELNLIAPSDSQTIYDVNSLYNNNISGKGQTLAIVGQTDIETYKSDIQHFRELSGLDSANMPTQVVVPNTGNAAVSARDLQEADIDVEWSGAIAKDASILYVTVGGNQNYSVFDALQYVIDKDLAPVISISYGGCENTDIPASYMQTLETSLEQANSQGQTVVAASGDDGSAQCDDNDSTPIAAQYGLSVNYPSSSPYVTSAGGTSFSGDLADQSRYWSKANNADNGSALSYIPESAWNNTPTVAALQSNGALGAGGGGASAVYAKPAWQSGAGVPSDGKRDVPDISLSADPSHDGYVLCTEQTNSAGTQLISPPASTCAYPVTGGEVPYFNAKGEGYLYGGTSIVAPQLAAMITLWNQKAGNTTGSGNINPTLYTAAQNSPGAFHDVMTGSNAVVCKQGSKDCISNGAGGYVMNCCSAGPGYDMATGLGSVDAAAMAAIWPASTPVMGGGTFSLASNPTALSVAAGASTTSTLVLTSNNGFSGAVALKCSNLPAETTCGFSPASPSLTAGASQNVTLTFTTTSSASMKIPPRPFPGNRPLQAVFASVFGLALFGVGRKKRRFPRGWMAVLLLVAGLVAATAMTACGGGAASGGSSSSNPTTPVSTTTTVTVTGTSGSNTASTRIALTIS